MLNTSSEPQCPAQGTSAPGIVGPEHTESSKTFTQNHKLLQKLPPGKCVLYHSQDGEAEKELLPSGHMPHQQLNTTQHYHHTLYLSRLLLLIIVIYTQVLKKAAAVIYQRYTTRGKAMNGHCTISTRRQQLPSKGTLLH